MAPRILTLSESWMSVPATLQDFRPEKDLSLLGVPNRMATDFVGLRAIPFSQNQIRREFKHDSSAEMTLTDLPLSILYTVTVYVDRRMVVMEGGMSYIVIEKEGNSPGTVCPYPDRPKSLAKSKVC